MERSLNESCLLHLCSPVISCQYGCPFLSLDQSDMESCCYQKTPITSYFPEPKGSHHVTSFVWPTVYAPNNIGFQLLKCYESSKWLPAHFLSNQPITNKASAAGLVSKERRPVHPIVLVLNGGILVICWAMAVKWLTVSTDTSENHTHTSHFWLLSWMRVVECRLCKYQWEWPSDSTTSQGLFSDVSMLAKKKKTPSHHITALFCKYFT